MWEGVSRSGGKRKLGSLILVIVMVVVDNLDANLKGYFIYCYNGRCGFFLI